jgi:uncharacterized protein YlxW (UPF0749 family)
MKTTRLLGTASARDLSRPTGGAARVSMAWMIAVIMLFLIAIVVAFMAYDEGQKLKEESARLKAQAAEADTNRQKESNELTTLSNQVGWFDKSGGRERTNLTAMAADVATLKATFPEIGASVTNLQDALPIVIQAYTARGREIATLNDAKNALESEKRTLDQSLHETLRDKDTQIANLQRQLDDANANATQKQAELEGRVAALRTQNSDLDAQLRTQRATTDANERKYKADEVTWRTRFQEQGSKLAFLKEPEAPDASILAVSTDRDLGWINIGANHRLARGTRFRIVSGKTGAKQIKAWAEVTRTEPGRSEVRFYDIADRFDPPVPGDIAYNPLYDPKGERNAVLVGRFSVPSENEVRAMLKNMGITVQDKLDNTTDYLIVGSEIFVDAEGNTLETPMQPSELPVYKDAEASGVQITPIKDLRSYFKF